MDITINKKDTNINVITPQEYHNSLNKLNILKIYVNS